MSPGFFFDLRFEFVKFVECLIFGIDEVDEGFSREVINKSYKVSVSLMCECFHRSANVRMYDV